ncbi:MAG: phage tail tube protein, partial [Pseudomonadota bacterium]
MPLITKKAQIAAKVESVEGTAETLTATEAILAGGWEFDPEIEMQERPAVSASLSSFAKVAGGRKVKISFKTELKGSGAAGTAPEVSALLQACGLSETISAGVSVAYAPASSSIPSITIGAYCDGKRYLAAGCRGNVKLDAKAGGLGELSFEFTGTAMADSDTALLSPTYDSTTPPPFLDASLALDSVAADIESLSIDLGNEVQLRPSANA